MAKNFDIVTLVLLVPHGDDSGFRDLVDDHTVHDMYVAETVTVPINDGFGTAWHKRTQRSPRIPDDAYG